MTPLQLKILERYGSQANFALRLGMQDSVISRTLNGYRKLSVREAKKWQRLLGCSFDLLVPFVKDAEPFREAA
jgi:hypothetical protein